MYALTKTSLNNLHRAKLAFIAGQSETSHNPPCGGKWATDLSFTECRMLVGESFAGNEKIQGEPTFDWILEPFVFPSIKERIDLCSFLMSFCLREAWARTCVIFAVRDDSIATKHETGDVKNWIPKGAVIVREYDARKESRWLVKLLDKIFENLHFLKSFVCGHVPSIMFKKGNLLEQQAAPFLNSVTPNHKKFGPKHPHWYVNIVMTSPDFQGQGVGSSLMTRIGELADAESVYCYLECGSEKNKRFYEKFGYQTVGTETFQNVVLAEGKPLTVYYMTRPHGKVGPLA